MILTGMIVVTLVVVLVVAALAQTWRLGLGFQQALFYLPLKLIYRIDDRRIRTARRADAPVIYAVSHQSRLDPALMLALLPEDTLHILDEESAASSWLEPYRSLARTISFNTAHVFVSRRLVRHLKGKGRLAVYLPHTVEPDAKSFRMFRAVARIAAAAICPCRFFRRRTRPDAGCQDWPLLRWSRSRSTRPSFVPAVRRPHPRTRCSIG